MAYMASITHEFAFIDFPHNSVAIWTGEYRPPAYAIHFCHAAASTSCDIDFIFEVAGDRHLWTRGLPRQCLEQRRHAREADKMIGLRRSSAVVGISAKAASLGSWTTVMPPDCLSAERPAVS
jgi:hypothetical protein